MDKDFDYVERIDNNNPSTTAINRINVILKKFPKAKILLEVPNTLYLNERVLKELNPSVKIRIAGAYNQERLDIYKNETWKDKSGKNESDCKEYYYDSVIYSKNETLLILKAIDRIEKGIDKKWTDIEKLVYIYSMLKRNIMYDPKFESKSHKEVRSLRGLITGESVCAGFALILKEFLDRQGIPCHFVRGCAHAWNIVEIEGNLYPVDLTFENKKYRSGMDNTFKFLGQSVKSFNSRHRPAKLEPFKDYQSNLKEFAPQMLETIYKRVFRDYDYKMTTYLSERDNGEKFLLIQLGSKIIDNKTYYKYYYVDFDGKRFSKSPMIVYSNENVCKYIDDVRFAKPGITLGEREIVNGLFSKENIMDSRRKNTSFIGNISTNNGTKVILKTTDECAKFKNIPLVFNRTDKTTFILEKDSYILVKNIKVYRFNVYEIIRDKNKFSIKNSIIYSEKDLTKEKSDRFKDIFLSSKRISIKEKDNGGYVGTIEENGSIQMDSMLKKHFKHRRKTNVASYNEYKNTHLHLPTFTELEELYNKYDVFEIEVKNCRQTEAIVFSKDNTKVENKSVTAPMAYLAHAWHNAVGLAAFQPKIDLIYSIMCERFRRDVISKGVIDPIGLLNELRTVKELEGIDVTHIMYELFKNEDVADFINDLFIKSINPNKEPTKLPVVFSNGNEVNTGFKY